MDAREGGHGVVHLVQQLARAKVGVADEAPGQRGQQPRSRAAAKAVAAPAAQVREGAPLQPPYPAPLRHLPHSSRWLTPSNWEPRSAICKLQGISGAQNSFTLLPGMTSPNCLCSNARCTPVTQRVVGGELTNLRRGSMSHFTCKVMASETGTV